jgi:hypothetical protein
MIEVAALVGVAAVLGAVLMTVIDSAPSAAQAPTPAATRIAPGVSTVSPSQVIVTPLTNVAESTTSSLSEGEDAGRGSSGATTAVVAGVVAGAVVIFAGIAYRLARGRPRAG